MVVGGGVLESVQVSLHVVPWYLRKLAGSVLLLVVRVGYSVQQANANAPSRS
jgi:hypothetical protein